MTSISLTLRSMLSNCTDIPAKLRWLFLLCVLCISNVHAQTPAGNPSTAEMIEQLKAPAVATGTRGLSRGLRNLEVVAAPPPSLSLQIQFDFNSARVSPVSQQALKNLAKALQSPELTSSKFLIEGHTDAKGKDDYNLKLSQLRADAVRQYLMAQSVDGERLRAEGKGSQELANAADPFAAENRRVRVVNLLE